MSSVKTETETVIKRILPYLQRRGYDPTVDFDYETATKSTTRYKAGYVDIVVLSKSGVPAFLVEAKRSSRKLIASDVSQAFEYGRSLRVPFVVVTNGTDFQCFNVASGDAIKWDGKLEGKVPTKHQLASVLRSFRANKLISDVSLTADSSIPFRPGLPLKQLNALFARCHNTIRKIEKNEEHAFADFSKLLFLKLLEEKADLEDSTLNLPYSYLFHELAAKPDREADQVKDAVERMIAAIKKTTSYGDVLSNPIHLKQAKTFHYIVKQLSEVSFEDSGLDYKGAAFEYFVRATLKGKKLGQYFTPRPLVELMSLLVGKEALVNAAIANQPTKVLDPACGTGGFLVFMLKRALTQLKARLESKSISRALHDHAAQRLKSHIFFGSDANDGVAATAKMNMIIAGDGHTNICPEDSLRIGATSWNVGAPDCDYILTNPPFGTSESESLPASELTQFPIRTTKGQNLFLQKMIRCTKPGGYICTVIDDGVLNTDTAATLRRYLIEECKLLLVIQLPDETFKPNKINVRSSVLLLQRRDGPDRPSSDTSPVTFCKLTSLGYDGAGDKIRGFDVEKLFSDFECRVMDRRLAKSRRGPHWTAFDVPTNSIAADGTTRFDLKYWEPSITAKIGKLKRTNGVSIGSINLIDTRRGKSPPADVYVHERDGFALVVKAGSNISQHGLLVTAPDSDYVEKSVFEDLPEFCKIQQGDVLVSSTGDGTLGKACVYDRASPAIADGHVTIIRLDQTKFSPYFIADYLRCGFGSEQVSRLYSGSTGLIELTPEHVKEILVPALKIAAQKKASAAVRKAEQEFREGQSIASETLTRARKGFAATI